MALQDFFTNFTVLLRWFHTLSAISWVGLTLAVVVLWEHRREGGHSPDSSLVHWWLRWTATASVIFGAFLLIYKYGLGNLWREETGAITDRALWVILGSVLGVLMWVNEWVLCGSAHKRLNEPAIDSAQRTEGEARIRFFRRLNVYLAGPTLFAMIAPNNYGAINVVTVAVILVLGAGAMHGLLWLAERVQRDVRQPAGEG